MDPTVPEPPVFVELAAHPLRWRLLAVLAGGDRRVRELAEGVGEPQNLVSYHLRRLRAGGLVAARRSGHDGRDTYYRLDLERCAGELAAAGGALHPALRMVPPVPPVPPDPSAVPELPDPPRVLFACTGNSARSPIAAALMRRSTGGRVATADAGSAPKERVHPAAVRVLRERYGIDIAERRPRHLDTLAGRRFDYVVTLCDRVREVCPEFPGRPRRIHWSVPDPAPAAGRGADGGADRSADGGFARTAAEIEARVRHLLPVLIDQPHPEVRS
ncbi:arsenate reductase/protein-tyrosine-phosphatase family protein [Nocardiopsis suaedae]|uniref:ArsR family transcriptional regulator n=1 Tax=Nocardiopsis suaedae TaxID=3018444 RepID=A0ABT4TJA0_9ACTN|nr:ArsR family transcriptional regulator [Nocardiopsis suaedae]MDA2804192.1 ArsR family transcriptional regulator [Nocardiopsis suaedae]